MIHAYAKYVFQNVLIRFDKSGVLEYEQKEITYMANEERETKQTLMNIILIMSIVICSAFIIFYFLPLFQVYEYDYSHGTTHAI